MPQIRPVNRVHAGLELLVPPANLIPSRTGGSGGRQSPAETRSAPRSLLEVVVDAAMRG